MKCDICVNMKKIRKITNLKNLIYLKGMKHICEEQVKQSIENFNTDILHYLL